MGLQLNFLGDYLQQDKKEVAQAEFWDNHYQVVVYKREPTYAKVDEFFTNLNYRLLSDYTGYWQSIAPSTDSEIFKRWLFAFMSVHTSWQSNIAGYMAIKNYTEWCYDLEKLRERLIACRVGMHNNRFKYISEFTRKFWDDPEAYKKSIKESWSELRDRLVGTTLGLGNAKVSFALEMCYPNEAKVTCLDTHMFQAYRMDQTTDMRRYRELERHWVEMSSMWNIPPYIARCIYWDLKQGYTDSRYWSFVLENA